MDLRAYHLRIKNLATEVDKVRSEIDKDPIGRERLGDVLDELEGALGHLRTATAYTDIGGEED